ncbi:alpha/beta fold hydrolase [Paenibacillus validus]|uniref:Alpha/beta fold hydrolase n=1 Tax=Paenibacillus validus TaxID=44253 RepID=A0A7X3CW62_9BACL|nr:MULTISPECIES: alpha/beta fold hydrolase [Paenibacillus]MED4603992.1 alpha/beta fold hydrolase [Paenibacillus validus]MED4609822.1 alpha/beta fold hydrolase [Paenibacillus validus]MUG73872.1 alpha/beta fold hydrolase [Paenibacillus validus]
MAEERACLLLHGFTGGPYEVQPLADYLQGYGYDCHVPTLPGHDPELLGLAASTWQDWLDAAADEARRLSRHYASVDLIGFSMGGLISAYLANRFPIRRLVLLSAAAIYISPVRFMRDLVDRMRTHDWEHWQRVKRVPLPAAVQFMKLARFAKRHELNRISVPTLIIQGRQDQIVHPRSARYIYNRIQGEKELLYVPKSRHLLCLEPEAAEVFQAVRRFLTQ